MYYTVEQASKELNISKQAIYKQIKKEEFKKFIIIEKGIKHINADGLKSLKGENPLEKVVKQQVEEIERLRADNKRLMILLEQQNQIILNSQELQKKALNNTELLLLEKREELKRRAEEYNKRSNHWFNMFKIKFI
ncbi:TPA: helix-turn-helix domain-containing protein [Clostridium perfringens]|nr:helix-turn-helix domain-containing protein [Clostridium perfringens]